MSLTDHQPQRLGDLDLHVSANSGIQKWDAGWERLRGGTHSCNEDDQETLWLCLCNPSPLEDLVGMHVGGKQ